MTCESCGDKPKKCDEDFTRAVVEIDNPEQITLMRKVTIPASMGDDTTVPPAVGKYHNVLLYYEANQKSYLYSSDGIPTQLVNGVTDYEAAVNLPQINGNTLIGDKTGDQLGLQDKLTAGDNITIENNVISATDTTYGPATDTEIGLVKPGDGLEIAVDGTMSISDIEQYAHFFDTVADMNASDLADGDYAKTLGYYTKDDMGGAYYKISSTIPSGYYETLTSGLYAELILEDTMSVKQFGANGDGVADDTVAIQTAVDNCLNVCVPEGTYMVNAITHINLRSGNKLELDNGAVIKAITNAANSYTILLVDNCEDVEICGGTIEGERNTHTGTSGEWGHCIYVNGDSDNIYIHDINLINSWGDGLCCNITGSMRTARVHVNNARRNGYSITMVDSFVSTNDIIENTHGTNPQCGVDVEPNLATDLCREIVFDNLYTKNNTAYGFIAALIGGNETNNFTNIKVNNMRSQGDNRGIGVRPGAGRLGEITFNEPVITNSTLNGILVDTSSTCRINIIRPIVKYYGCNAAGDTGIYLQGTLPSGADSIGNIWVYEPVVTNPVEAEGITTSWAIDARSTLQDVHIINPVDLDNRLIRASMNDGCIIKDGNKILNYDRNGNYSLSRDNFRINNHGKNYTANHNITIHETNAFPVGTKFNFLNDGDYQMVVKFPGNYIYPISSTTGTNVTLTNKGASMTIERIASDAWAIINQNGTITSS